MKRDSRKIPARPTSRPFPTLLTLLDRIGGALVEGIAGLWLGLALAVLAAWLAAQPMHHLLSGETVLGTPDHLCTPRIGGGPYLDGDRVTLADGSALICDGISGNWESPAARAQRRAGWDATGQPVASRF